LAGESVTIRNGNVSIDGAEVTPDLSRFTAKTGKIYVIERVEGRISVRSEEKRFVAL
jgi:hypothetical protein